MAETKQSFPIKGMHCASCVKVTERALKKTPGVTDAVVNLATEKATVTYDKDNCTPEQLANSIAKTGYILDLEEKIFKPPEKRPSMVQNMRTMFTRMGATEQEIRTLRGIVKALVQGRRSGSDSP